jgi:hypothetical protein
MTLFSDCGQMNVAQRKAHRLYLWATFIYCITLLLAVWLSRHFKSWHWKPLFMVVPIAAVVLLLRAMMLYFSAADEMQRRILSEGCAYAFTATVFASLVCGFFEGDVIPVIPWWARLTFMMTVWALSVQFAKARYK